MLVSKLSELIGFFSCIVCLIGGKVTGERRHYEMFSMKNAARFGKCILQTTASVFAGFSQCRGARMTHFPCFRKVFFPPVYGFPPFAGGGVVFVERERVRQKARRWLCVTSRWRNFARRGIGPPIGDSAKSENPSVKAKRHRKSADAQCEEAAALVQRCGHPYKKGRTLQCKSTHAPSTSADIITIYMDACAKYKDACHIYIRNARCAASTTPVAQAHRCKPPRACFAP